MTATDVPSHACDDPQCVTSHHQARHDPATPQNTSSASPSLSAMCQSAPSLQRNADMATQGHGLYLASQPFYFIFCTTCPRPRECLSGHHSRHHLTDCDVTGPEQRVEADWLGTGQSPAEPSLHSSATRVPTYILGGHNVRDPAEKLKS